MKILVTGGLGFLGHHVVESLLKTTDAEIVVLDKMTYASSGFDRLRDIQVYDDKRVCVLGCDLSQSIPEGVAHEVGEVDYIIHAAAETHVDNSIVDPLPFLMSNVVGTHHLLMWMRSLKTLRRAFLVSTDEVYGPASLDDKENAFDEQAPFRPANPYCLVPSTLISVASGGQQLIGALVPQALLSFDFGNNRVVATLPVAKLRRSHSKNAANLIRIETERQGCVECSKEHRFFVKRPDRWKNGAGRPKPDWIAATPMVEIEAQDLRVGDFLATSRIVPAPLAQPFVTPSLARLLGYFIGDGSVATNKNNYIRLADGDRRLLEGYDAIVRVALQGWNETSGAFASTPAPVIYKHGTKKCWYLQFGCKKFRALLIDLGMHVSARKKQVPSKIMTATDDEVAQFLAGLYDADGSSSDHEVTFGSASRDLMVDVAQMLRRFGVMSSLTTGSWKGRNAFTKLSIGDGLSLRNLHRYIPVLKTLKLRWPLPTPQRANEDPHLAWTRVQNVSVVGSVVEALYDFDVPPHRNYILGDGIIVHNSAAKAGGECVAMAYANTYKLPITVAATMNLVGERQHWEKYVPLVIRRALSGEVVKIHSNPERTKSGTRFYLHCRTYAHALGFLIDRDLRGEAMPPKVNICGEREISNLDLAQLIASIVGKPLNYELVDFHSSRPGHDLAYRMNDALIRDLGWKRPMNLEQSLEKTVRWYLSHPKWLGL